MGQDMGTNHKRGRVRTNHKRRENQLHAVPADTTHQTYMARHVRVRIVNVSCSCGVTDRVLFVYI